MGAYLERVCISKSLLVHCASTKEAQDTMLNNKYASAHTMGEFISQLVMDYHAQRTRQLTQAEIAQELHRLASLLEAKENHDDY